MPGGSGRSLSIVLGTWATWIVPFACAYTCDPVNAVSSPPMVTRYLIPSLSSPESTAAMCAGSFVGLVRLVPSSEPPRW